MTMPLPHPLSVSAVFLLLLWLRHSISDAWSTSSLMQKRRNLQSHSFSSLLDPSRETTSRLFFDIMDEYQDDYVDDDYMDVFDDDYVQDDYLRDFDCLGSIGGVSEEISSSWKPTSSSSDEIEPSLGEQSQEEDEKPWQVRAQIAGVSVSKDSGFWVMLRLPHHNDQAKIWPIQVTNHDFLDRTAATSGQALTLVQLLSSVDMAGVILPPTVLAQLLLVALEEQEQDQEATDKSSWQTTWTQHVKKQIRSLYGDAEKHEEDDDDFLFADASLWIRSRVRLPVCTLDEVHIDISSDDDEDTVSPRIQLDVIIRSTDVTADSNNGPQQQEDHYRFSLNDLSESTVANVIQEEYKPIVSRHFVAIALALRYKAPIVVSMPKNNKNVKLYSSETELKQQAFPMYTTVSNLQQSSTRVVQNIERGFEIHQLQAALNIARKKQDFKAMAKIQEKIDALDQEAFQDLPVQPESDMDCMQ